MKIRSLSLLLLSAVLLASCQTDDVISLESESATPPPANGTQSGSATSTNRPATAAIIRPGQAECAIYYAIEGRLLLEKRNVRGNIVDGCPPESSVGADISPDGSSPSSALARSLVNRMVEKGVPQDVANDVSRSPAFRQWLQQAG